MLNRDVARCNPRCYGWREKEKEKKRNKRESERERGDGGADERSRDEEKINDSRR